MLIGVILLYFIIYYYYLLFVNYGDFLNLYLKKIELSFPSLTQSYEKIPIKFVDNYNMINIKLK
jgi:hypothetical protein